MIERRLGRRVPFSICVEVPGEGTSVSDSFIRRSSGVQLSFDDEADGDLGRLVSPSPRRFRRGQELSALLLRAVARCSEDIWHLAVAGLSCGLLLDGCLSREAQATRSPCCRCPKDWVAGHGGSDRMR